MMASGVPLDGTMNADRKIIVGHFVMAFPLSVEKVHARQNHVGKGLRLDRKSHQRTVRHICSISVSVARTGIVNVSS